MNRIAKKAITETTVAAIQRRASKIRCGMIRNHLTSHIHRVFVVDSFLDQRDRFGLHILLLSGIGVLGIEVVGEYNG